MDKVKITQELANAIEAVKTKGIYDNKNFEILEMATKSPKDDDIMFKEHEIIYLFCHHDGIDILIQALVNGYEVEETPEDRFKQFLKELPSSHLQTALNVINIFDIKVKGISDHE